MNGQTDRLSSSSEENFPPISPDVVEEKAEKSQDLTPRVLELSGLLQTTLEINELIALFSSELGRHLKFDGLHYRFENLDIEIKLGRKEVHSCAYELTVAGEHLGGAQFFRDTPFTRPELVTAENLLSALLYPLRNTLLYQKALRSASMDPVTGIKNRVAMESTVKREINLARRNQAPLSFIMMDLDHFKKINDRYGHLYGDQALFAAAQCVQETIRDSDLVFRYGGEEFLVTLTGTDLDGASLLAERIRQKIEQLEPDLDKKIKMTASFGVVSMRDEEDAEQVYQRVDDALYKAKKGGRNQVVTAE
jgi:diguanylate cyclase (GGDEF)-like protein